MGEWVSNIVCFFMDVIDAIYDICNTWKEKDEKILTKIMCTIITLIFLGVGAYIWLV